MNRLILCDDFRTAWRVVVKPWLEQFASAAWKQTRPTVLLCANLAQANGLRQAWLEQNHGFLGLRFWTPVDARAYLARVFPQKQLAITRENMHLMLSGAAEELIREEQRQTGQVRPGSYLSIVTDSTVLALAMDELGAAGWSWEEQGPEWSRPLLALYHQSVEACGLTSLQQYDRALSLAALSSVKENGPLLGPLLLYGLGAEQWPRWITLRTAAAVAESTCLIVPHPGTRAEEASQTWISTWEKWLAAEPEFASAFDEEDAGTNEPAIALQQMEIGKSKIPSNESNAINKGATGGAFFRDLALRLELEAGEERLKTHQVKSSSVVLEPSLALSSGALDSAPLKALSSAPSSQLSFTPIARPAVRFHLARGIVHEARVAALQAIAFLEEEAHAKPSNFSNGSDKRNDFRNGNEKWNSKNNIKDGEKEESDNDHQVNRERSTSKETARVAIVVPGNCALAREIAALLAAWEVPHFDAPGHRLARQLGGGAWEAWLDFQERPCRRTLFRLLRVWPTAEIWPEDPRLLDEEEDQQQRQEDLIAAPSTESKSALRSKPMSLASVEEAINRALAQLYVDDVRMLRDHLSESKSARDRAVGDFLQRLVLLPELGLINLHLAAVEKAFALFPWLELLALIQQQSIFLRGPMALPLSRRIFLRWLREISADPTHFRDASGRHFYARLHIVTYEEAAYQRWTHLVLTSLADGVWPPRYDESAFLGAEDLRQLNEQLRQWNRAILQSSPSGQGEFIPNEGRAWCLSPLDRRQLAEAQLVHLVGAPTCGLALTSRLSDESDSSRELNTGAFYSRLYLLCHGEWLDEHAAQLIAQATEAMTLRSTSIFESEARRQRKGNSEHSSDHRPDNTAAQHRVASPISQRAAFSSEFISASSPEQTRRARIARMGRGERANGGAPTFTEYDFCTRLQSHPLTITCCDWEIALRAPALIWMKYWLGVEPDRAEDEDLTSRTVGEWVHRWLADVPKTQRLKVHSPSPLPTLEDAPPPRYALPLVDVPPAEMWRAQLQRSAIVSCRHVEQLATRYERSLPVLWKPMWGHALHLAGELADAVLGHDFPQIATEITLPPRQRGRNDGGRTSFVACRIAGGAELLVVGRPDVLLFRPKVEADSSKSNAPQAPNEEMHYNMQSTNESEENLFSWHSTALQTPFPAGDWLILDYKTGRSAEHLKAARVNKGFGLQLALYALALEQLGAEQPHFAYALHHGDYGTTPLSLEQIPRLDEMLVDIAAMQNKGRFGWHGEVRPEFGFTFPYPLATLPVAEETLELKWRAEHPGLSGVL